MSTTSRLLLLTFLTILFSLSIAKTPKTAMHGVVLPITKATSPLSSPQYTTTITLQTHSVPVKLTLDLGGKNSWLICADRHFNSTSYRHITCDAAPCKLVSGICQDCHAPPFPGCHPKMCTTQVTNRMTKHHLLGELGQYTAIFQSQNDVVHVHVPGLIFACGVTSILEGLAKGVVGMMGLGTNGSPISLPSLLSNPVNKLPKKFAICLSPSTKAKGVVIFGNKPYSFTPHADVSVFLLYTPLIVNQHRTPGLFHRNDPSPDYFINLTSIRINGEDLPLNKALLTINKNGYGGTKFSTIEPYTIMQSSIYKLVKNAYIKELSHVARVKAVAPFEVCYSAKSLPNTQVGPSAPFVDFVMHHKDVFWRIYGANSLVSVNNGEVLCMGFVDGGDALETSIVIGGHQMENSFLLFDVENQRLGFSSTLLLQRTSCGHYNVTWKR